MPHFHQCVFADSEQWIVVKMLFKAEVWLMDPVQYEKFLHRRTDSFLVIPYSERVHKTSPPSSGEWHVVVHRYGVDMNGVYGTKIEVEVRE